MIRPMAGYGGIDLGGTKIQAIVVDDANTVLGSARRPTPTSGGPAAVAAEMEGALRDAAAAAQLEPPELAGVGAGSPGTVGADGSVSSARNLPDWDGSFPLAEALAGALGVQVRVGNDVEVATQAELLARRGTPLPLARWASSGAPASAAALILDGRAWRGRGGAGEIGHWSWRSTARAARAGGAAAWRPTPGARRWKRTSASSSRRATRPISSSSWRSTTRSASRAASGRARSITATSSPST